MRSLHSSLMFVLNVPRYFVFSSQCLAPWGIKACNFTNELELNFVCSLQIHFVLRDFAVLVNNVLWTCKIALTSLLLLQEIVGALVTHIGSGYQAEADSSLDVLCDLATSHTDIVAPFAVFIKGILDYLDNLKIRQIRKLFSILSILAFQNPQEVGLIQVHKMVLLLPNCPKMLFYLSLSDKILELTFHPHPH